MLGMKRSRTGSRSGSPTFSDSDGDGDNNLEEKVGVGISSEGQGGTDKHSSNENYVEINPMLNPVILDGLFGACELIDLKRFRLVCNLWLDVSLKRWRKDMVVSIQPPGQTSGLNWNNLDLLYVNPDIREAKPFRKFRLRKYEFSKMVVFPTWHEVDKRSTFWKMCGPWVHHLEICDPVIKCVQLFYNIVVKQTPNLKSLKLVRMPNFTPEDDANKKKEEKLKTNFNLESLSVTVGDEYSNQFIPFRRLITHFPNIKNLTLESMLKEDLDDLTQVLEELNFRPTKKGVGGKKLNIIYKDLTPDPLQDPDATAPKNFFSLPYISLSNLEVELDSALDENFLSDLLQLHQNKLTTLDLGRDQDCDIPPRNPFLQTQPFLTKLRLQWDVVDNLHFLEDTPNLTLLHFSEFHLRSTLSMTNTRRMESRVRLAKLKMLRFIPRRTGQCHDFSVPEMKMIVKCMPHVKQFVGPLTNDTFAVVCEGWRGLKVLQITFSMNPVDDSGITGVVKSRSWDEELRRANITDLTYLCKFGIASKLLSDDSVWNGFLKLKYLYALKVELSGETSNEAFSALFNRFPSVFVTRSLPLRKEKQQLNHDLQAKAAQLWNDFGIK